MTSNVRRYLTTFRTSFTQKMVTTSLTQSFEAMYYTMPRPASSVSQLILVLFDLDCIQEELQRLIFDIDSSHNVFVLGLRWRREHFAEDVQPAVASNESHEMIATFLRLIQGISWGVALAREDQFLLHAGQCLERGFSLDLAVAIGTVVPVLECQRFLHKLRH